jgi:RNA polymerase sigma factor (sigma-70 family)
VGRKDQERLLERWANAHVGILRKVARAFARDADDQADLIQELLHALWLALPGFRGESSSATFVYRVAHNRALNWQRARRRYRKRVDDAQRLGALTPPPPADPDSHRQLEQLYQVIRALPPLDRTLVLLYLDDLSYAAIHEITGLTESHIGVRLTRIRRELARRLNPAAVAAPDTTPIEHQESSNE